MSEFTFKNVPLTKLLKLPASTLHISKHVMHSTYLQWSCKRIYMCANDCTHYVQNFTKAQKNSQNDKKKNEVTSIYGIFCNDTDLYMSTKSNKYL